ncbi:MAG TPA: CHASE3 domain-containing protein [Thauera sp.]|uniref:CHASE3 domain-containing protein n=1 Tax=Thauera sp. TaxID=1905334 RepID=UPI002BB4A556|nr:CHASE3 domain-containing protein [Thauera sp.]HRP26181.1 CHASE3 domain-containing protein [Thauera sp.]HRP66734.1 CHASE3 domain-containing protein [Thauera sp.]
MDPTAEARPVPPPPSRLPRPHTGTLLAVLLLSLVLGLAWFVAGQWQSESSRAALEDLRARTARLHHLDTLLLQILDAESSVRGYLLTRNPVYLSPYQDGHAALELTLDALRAGAEPDEAPRERVDQLAMLIDMRWTLLTQAIERGEPPGADSPDGGIGKQVTDDIRNRIQALRAETQADIAATQGAAFERLADARTMNRVLGAGVLALLLVLVVVLYRQDRLRERMALLLHSENERLQTEVTHRTQELSSLASYLTNAREAEKGRLARELHDELGALLTAAKLDAAWIARKLPAEAVAQLRSRFDRLLDTLNQGIALKRKVVADLRPPLLSELGLVEALRALADSGDIGEGGGRLETELPEQLPELPPETSLALYRIAQEALTNARRYAHAQRVRLSLRTEGDELILEVEDDGVGFDPATREHNRHGLAGMAHRVQMLAGRLDIDSRPQHGTRITARVPFARMH